MIDLPLLTDVYQRHRAAFAARVQEFSLGGRYFAFNSKPALMGVINLSTDSWYRESVSLNAASAIQRGKVLYSQGAAIVDIGAESTLANAGRAGIEAQAQKLIPVIEGLRSEGILVSVETYEPEVARRSLAAKANVINLTGRVGTEEIFGLAAIHDAAVIICYVEGTNVREVADFSLAGDPVDRMRGYFAEQITLAKKAGLEKIFIDPGLGFYYRNLQDSSVRVRHQMVTFLNTFRLRQLGYPVCHALPHAFEFFQDEVRNAEPFFAVLAALGKTDLFRTHEVPKVRAVLETMRSV